MRIKKARGFWPYPGPNCKLRGKKTKRLSCGCCVMENTKNDYFWNLALKEITEYN